MTHMSDQIETPQDETPLAPAEEGQEPVQDAGEGTGEPEGADALGDAGKKALDSMKTRWKAERDARRKLEEELESLRTPKPSGDDDQADAAEIKRQATREANAKANARIIRSEIKAAAAGKLADPSDALAYLDPSAFELDANGDVDAEELADAIEDLLTRKPYLAATTRPRFQGTGDGGAARKASGPSQLSRQDLKSMSPEAIVKAKREGRLKDVLGG
ncbi:head scaffolding protein [Streptomyces phage Dubu]|uniref:Scaffolding protein n=1 Tax=Streptomyces phage Dubu TaxID=2591226 RepID=A0A514DES3_9CAUD|nr:head scaffolding protein [Streptomyces phage Dubu]QDH92110.1 hypothetical protein SEA_DUBU_5 [Streptomyces phage Dubu]